MDESGIKGRQFWIGVTSFALSLLALGAALGAWLQGGLVSTPTSKSAFWIGVVLFLIALVLISGLEENELEGVFYE